jgi:hypothetical protein
VRLTVPQKEIVARARAEESRQDWEAAAGSWRELRENVPSEFLPTFREILILRNLRQFDLAHSRLLTALQKFSTEKRLLALKGPIEKQAALFHRQGGLAALQANDLKRAAFHYQALTALEPKERFRWQYLDRSRELSPDFADVLARIDGGNPKNRIYILGCGRSGTYLLTSLMECFRDTAVLIEEVPYGRFARFLGPERTHVLKRDVVAQYTIDLIPSSISLLYIIRFPLDVLVSRHLRDDFYIKPDHWRREIAMLRRIHKKVTVVRYEDLVSEPDKVQQWLAQNLGVEPQRPFSSFDENLKVGNLVARAMHGVRPVSARSVGRWRDPDLQKYCKSIWPGIRDDVAWVCDTFGYEFPAL